ncbi:hypothetical protein HN51_059708 [Arachis hypogaea]
MMLAVLLNPRNTTVTSSIILLPNPTPFFRLSPWPKNERTKRPITQTHQLTNLPVTEDNTQRGESHLASPSSRGLGEQLLVNLILTFTHHLSSYYSRCSFSLFTSDSKLLGDLFFFGLEIKKARKKERKLTFSLYFEMLICGFGSNLRCA